MIPHTTGQLMAAIGHASFTKLSDQEARAGFFERPASAARFFRVGKAGQWRDHLTPQQIDRIATVHRAQILRFGYWPLK